MGSMAQAWIRRVALGLIFGGSILLWGALAHGAIEFVSMMLGELSEHAERTMLLLTAAAWVPLAIGTAWLMSNSAVMPRHEDDGGRRVP